MLNHSRPRWCALCFCVTSKFASWILGSTTILSFPSTLCSVFTSYNSIGHTSVPYSLQLLFLSKEGQSCSFPASLALCSTSTVLLSFSIVCFSLWVFKCLLPHLSFSVLLQLLWALSMVPIQAIMSTLSEQSSLVVIQTKNRTMEPSMKTQSTGASSNQQPTTPTGFVMPSRLAFSHQTYIISSSDVGVYQNVWPTYSASTTTLHWPFPEETYVSNLWQFFYSQVSALFLEGISNSKFGISICFHWSFSWLTPLLYLLSILIWPSSLQDMRTSCLTICSWWAWCFISWQLAQVGNYPKSMFKSD